MDFMTRVNLIALVYTENVILIYVNVLLCYAYDVL